MPTVTGSSQVAFTNVGPLTTVFTAPAACATAAPDVWLAMSNEEMSSRVIPFYKKSCEATPLGECYASGAKLDEARTSVQSAGHAGMGTIAYFSPASACPDSHTTVGVAAKGEDGKVTSSGLFVPPVVTSTALSGPGDLLVQNPPLNLLMEVLDKTETAVLCCPQGYTAGYNGGCFSTVPESAYGEKTACFLYRGREDYTRVTATFTYNDTVVTGLVFSITVSSQAFETKTTSVPESFVDASFYAVVSKPGYTLIRGGAVQETGSASGTTGSASGTAAPTQTGASAANGFRMATSGGGVGVLATVWAFAALAGVALASPL